MRQFGILTVCMAGVVILACSGGSDDFSIDEVAGDWAYETDSPNGGSTYNSVLLYDWPEDEHCDWAPLALLLLDTGDGSSIASVMEFVRSEESDPSRAPVSGFVGLNATVPDDAKDTGYTKNGARLYVALDQSSAWLVVEGHVERWPRQLPVLGCA